MAAFAETSFLFALHIRQTNHERARAYLSSNPSAVLISRFVRFEFENGVRLEAFIHRTQGHRGVLTERVPQILGAFEVELESGSIHEASCDWLQVADLAAELSNRHTIARGCRAFDLLHVATALHLGAREFLTFDGLQREVAEAEGLSVPL